VRARALGAAAPVAAIVLMAVNLRTVIASLPPLLPDVRHDLGLSAGVAGLLTTIPVLLFGALAPVAPRFAHRVSLERMLAACAALTAASAALRGTGGTAALFAGSILAGVAVGVAQAALPVLIRARHADRMGPLTGAYAMGLTIGASTAALTAVPLEDALGGWAGSLAFWALPALVALAVWLPAASRRGTVLRRDEPGPTWRSSLGWLVGGYFGVQNIAFYAGLAWLPTILENGGASSEAAGALQASAGLVSFIPAMLVPVLAVRRADQIGLLLAIVATSAAGVVGLLVAPGPPLPWVLVLGLGQGGALGLALILPVVRARGPHAVAALTAMSLTVGYIAAALGPWLLGAVHDAAGGWTVPLVVLLLVTVFQLAPGLPASRARSMP
jgi:CP family cyanate transporter-like MFS transporter